MFSLSRFFLILSSLFLLAPVQASPLNIVTSILPQKTFVEAIGGQHVHVTTLVMPGQSPATYEPTPKQMANLSSADLLYRIGVPFENSWINNIISRYPELKILDARDGVPLRNMEKSHDDHGHGHSHGHEERAKDPHIWVNPALVITMADAIKAQLSKLDPTNTSDYDKNHAAFVQKLTELDTYLIEKLSPLKHKQIMVFHPSWGYFTDQYGLTQVPIEQEGKTPGARNLSKLIHDAKEQGVHVIFAQKQFTTRYAKTVADAINGRVVAIDPLSPDYFANLRMVADAIIEAQP